MDVEIESRNNCEIMPFARKASPWVNAAIMFINADGDVVQFQPRNEMRSKWVEIVHFNDELVILDSEKAGA